MSFNVLILSAGRRVELLQSFQYALLSLELAGKVFALDMKPELSAACQVADGFGTVVRASDPAYVEQVISFCQKHDIRMVVPTIDTELLVLAEQKGKFDELGIHVVISSVELVQQCRDKRETGNLFGRAGIAYPQIYPADDLSFPCFCKPYDGSRSIGAQALLSSDDLTSELLANPKNMFMELVPASYFEYTVDVYFDRNGDMRCVVPRQRLEVRDGEVSKGVTRKNYVYQALIDTIGNLPGATGCITAQVFGNPETQDVKGLEINPRFGGGYPLSDKAGAQYAEWLIREYALGQGIPFYDGWKDNFLMLRHDTACWVEDYAD